MQWALGIVAVNVVISLLLALVIIYLLPGRRYPMPDLHHQVSSSSAIEIAPANIEWALRQMDSMIDVSKEYLAQIYLLAMKHARSHGNADVLVGNVD